MKNIKKHCTLERKTIHKNFLLENKILITNNLN